ncbi:MAG TPA: hypothetical protein VHD83_06045 [Puia sp.]|nr:hypothetical protein [Puia sp.]
MHDPKFENEVQKKLEELSFSPSEAVWTRVERAVNEKRRRRMPLFWFFLLPSLGLAGAGMIYYATHHRTIPVVPVAQVTQKEPVSAPVTPAPAVAAPSAPAPSALVPAPSNSTDLFPRQHIISERPAHQNVVSSSGRTAHQSIGSLPNKTAPEDVTSSPDETAPQNITSSPDQSDPENKVSSRTLSRAGVPGLQSFNLQFKSPTASRLASSSASAASTPINLQPKYSWEMGFAGGAGFSTLNKSLFQQPAVMASDVPAAALTSPMPVNAASKAPSSTVQPYISYWAGIVAERPLSKALTLSLGLNLHYYSTKLQVGEAVYNDPASFYLASTLLTQQQSAGYARSTVYPYYSVGDADVFVNRYYFLELPVSLLWQVNHSRRLPLFWENGLSLSYLVSTNSLYYNTKSGVFYKDQGSMTNKTQLNLSTALLVGLPIKNMRLQVGPQVQYGLTSLQHESSIGQHMFYGGIRVVLLPGKAKK